MVEPFSGKMKEFCFRYLQMEVSSSSWRSYLGTQETCQGCIKFRSMPHCLLSPPISFLGLGYDQKSEMSWSPSMWGVVRRQGFACCC